MNHPVEAKAWGEEAKAGTELKERTFWRDGSERCVGCALLVMELLAATQDKCPTYVESGRGREGGESSIAEMATNAGSSRVDRCALGGRCNA